MRTGVVFALLAVVGVVVIVRSLPVKGCLSFGLWLLVGLAVMWLVLQFMSGAWRV